MYRCVIFQVFHSTRSIIRNEYAALGASMCEFRIQVRKSREKLVYFFCVLFYSFPWTHQGKVYKYTNVHVLKKWIIHNCCVIDLFLYTDVVDKLDSCVYAFFKYMYILFFVVDERSDKFNIKKKYLQSPFLWSVMIAISGLFSYCILKCNFTMDSRSQCRIYIFSFFTIIRQCVIKENLWKSEAKHSVRIIFVLSFKEEKKIIYFWWIIACGMFLRLWNWNIDICCVQVTVLAWMR